MPSSPTLLRSRPARALTMTAVLALAACGNDDDGASVREIGSGSGSGSGSASASGSGSATAPAAPGECVLEGATDDPADVTVEVTLSDFAVTATPTEVPAGAVAFAATNDGALPHELVIAAYEGDPGDLPVDDDGAVDEDQLPEGSVIGEIEEFATDQSCTGTFELAAGDYVLFCNIVEDDDGVAHYHEGMYTTFTVT